MADTTPIPLSLGVQTTWNQALEEQKKAKEADTAAKAKAGTGTTGSDGIGVTNGKPIPLVPKAVPNPLGDDLPDGTQVEKTATKPAKKLAAQPVDCRLAREGGGMYHQNSCMEYAGGTAPVERAVVGGVVQENTTITRKTEPEATAATAKAPEKKAEVKLPEGFTKTDKGGVYTLQKDDAGSGITQIVKNKVKYVHEDGTEVTDPHELLEIAKGTVKGQEDNHYIERQSANYKPKHAPKTGIDKIDLKGANGGKKTDSITFANELEVPSKDKAKPAQKFILASHYDDYKKGIEEQKAKDAAAAKAKAEQDAAAAKEKAAKAAAAKAEVKKQDESHGVSLTEPPESHTQKTHDIEVNQRHEKWKENKKNGTTVAVKPDQKLADVVKKDYGVDDSTDQGKQQLQKLTEALIKNNNNSYRQLTPSGSFDFTDLLYVPKTLNIDGTVFKSTIFK